MKFKLDENLSPDLAEDLRMAGHDADTVADEGLGGAPDPDVLAAALSERRILLTLDKRIANLIQYPAHGHAGVVLFRPGLYGQKEIFRFIRARLPELLVCELADRLTVVPKERIRVR